jgi:beta-lactam-binding protein with PASTA domain
VTVTPPPAATRVVPDLIDSKLYETQAASILGSIGLTVNAVSDPAPPGSPESFIGLVTAQDTAPGSVVPVGTSITLHEYS